MLSFILSLFLSVPVFAQTTQEIQKSAVKILAISDTRVLVKDNGGFVKGHNVLVVRLKDDEDDFEIIARGSVVAIAKGKVVIDVVMDDLKKLPDKNDFVVSLGNPKVFMQPNPKVSEPREDLEQVPFEKPEPGYIALQYINLTSKIATETPNQANSLKSISKLVRTGFEMEWYLDFLSNYGIGFGQSSGGIPVQSYYRQDVDATYSETYFRLNYRTRKYFSNIRAVLFFMAISESFSTPNPDELVLSTTGTSNNLGVTVQWEPGELLLQGTGSRFQLTSLKLQYLTAFSYQVQDGVVSRGSSGKGQFNEIRFGANFTTYLPWMPWVKRYTFSYEQFTRDRKFNFSGTPKNENISGAYQIPANQQYGEIETGFMFTIGVRFEDMIGRLFKPKD